MRIHTSDKTYDIPGGAGKTLFDLVSVLPGVTLHTPCGGHGKCGKCICAVLCDGEPPLTSAESAFLDGTDTAAALARCGVPSELHASAHLRYLCLCPADGISDVYLPAADELTGAVFSETVAAASPVVTEKHVTLTMPTLENPVDTLENLRTALGCDADIPFSVVCGVSKELQHGVTDFTALVCGTRVIDIVRETAPCAFLAVDIGTTTVALSLRNMKTGAELCGDVFGNPQRSSGGDVIARMSRAASGEAEMLTNSIRTAIAEHTAKLCRRAGIEKDQILYTSIAGNSVMEHLYAGLDTAPIAVSPFFMQTKFGWEMRADDRLCGASDFMNPDGLVYLAPLAASYVGGDITVGLAYILEKHPEIKGKNALFMDLGTNGELCVIADGKYYFAATAAGPALEGAEIEMGMSATPGAVYKVKANAETGRFDVNVVGDGESSIGICGSGIIDAAAEAVRAGLIAPTGSICEDFDELEDYADMFDDAESREYDRDLFDALYETCVDEDDDCIYFTENVKLTGKDIRAVQTAKAAIAAGIKVLLRTAGITADDLDAVYLAGSFGGGIDVNSAAEIGIIPKTCVKRGIVQAAGNTSLAGAAAYMYDEAVRNNLREIMANARYTELSSDKGFTDAFVGGMMF